MGIAQASWRGLTVGPLYWGRGTDYKREGLIRLILTSPLPMVQMDLFHHDKADTSAVDGAVPQGNRADSDGGKVALFCKWQPDLTPH